MATDLHHTMDAQVWTVEWMKTIKEHPGIPNDEGAMLGWFANAIMAGYDADQQSVHLTALRRGLALSIFINVILLAVVMFTIGGR